MPRLVHTTPKYRKHRSSGQAVVSIAGVDHYLGPHGTKASKLEYDRLISEWLADGRPSIRTAAPASLTVKELIAAYWRFVRRHYVKNGRATAEQACIKSALKPLRRLYGHTPAANFGPKALKAIQRAMIDADQCRNTINKHVSRIRRMFRWATAEELLPASVHQALAALPGLQEGRCEARESEPVEPVADATVDLTLPHLPPIVADMVRFQRLAGCRPEEVCMLRPCDVDTSRDVWEYRPQSHKMEHKGRARAIFIGPKAQKVLRPYLLRDKEAHCFVPVESERQRNAAKREGRQSPMTPSQAARKAKRRKVGAPGTCYTTCSYRRAIHRACEVAFAMPAAWRNVWRSASKLPEDQRDELRAKANAWRAENCWSPNQLRHSAATSIRSLFGLEASQVVLGHSDAQTTQIYAERDFELARRIMGQVG